ncbi:FaeA/PapI family transcriptional regulator [Natronorarus salvus]|uniref:FaeA/PapI family transcriptional regulator n=1 Tax=Natronorarus salvus TaxID=3117733 RepID=UPI002F267698
MGRKRNKSGQFVEEIALKDVIGILQESDSPIATAKEVGETLGCSAEAARQKLLELRDQGLVARRQVGAGAVVWWLIDDEPTPEHPPEIDPNDPLFSDKPLLAPEDPVDETEIDDVLYGEG